MTTPLRPPQPPNDHLALSLWLESADVQVLLQSWRSEHGTAEAPTAAQLAAHVLAVYRRGLASDNPSSRRT